ncbi:hypothetical protein [uncultured Gimesia sp.]|uniref:hypothetical protein n=1 Tax=uncultured Gimesia sp. TaxID=1678688 RepID=UPI0030DA2F56
MTFGFIDNSINHVFDCLPVTNLFTGIAMPIMIAFVVTVTVLAFFILYHLNTSSTGNRILFAFLQQFRSGGNEPRVGKSLTMFAVTNICDGIAATVMPSEFVRRVYAP